MLRAGLRKKILAPLLTLATVAASLVAFAEPASAGTTTTDCSARAGGPAILYWGLFDQTPPSAYVCFLGDVADMYGYYFPRNGQGGGSRVWNNAASGCNMSTTLYAQIWYNQNYSGPHQTLMTVPDGPGQCQDFNSSLVNNNRALRFVYPYW